MADDGCLAVLFCGLLIWVAGDCTGKLAYDRLGEPRKVEPSTVVNGHRGFRLFHTANDIVTGLHGNDEDRLYLMAYVAGAHDLAASAAAVEVIGNEGNCCAAAGPLILDALESRGQTIAGMPHHAPPGQSVADFLWRTAYRVSEGRAVEKDVPNAPQIEKRIAALRPGDPQVLALLAGNGFTQHEVLHKFPQHATATVLQCLSESYVTEAAYPRESKRLKEK